VRLQNFAAAETAAQRQAAATATNVARASFKRKRELAPPRPGRSGQGNMTKGIQFSRVSPQQSFIQLRLGDLDKAAPHWIIQEIGTGQAANMMAADENGPRVSRAVTVKAQKGRVISSGLAWASQGRYVPPNSGGGTQNLFPRIGPSYAKGTMRIRREIQGQHFIQKGADAGFREYQTTVLAAARRELRKRKTV